MTEEHQHIVTKFDDNLSRLRNEVTQMGTSALYSLERAVNGLIQGNREHCSDVIADDEIIDKHEKKVDEHGMGILLSFQPVASDLRLVVSSLNIGRSLERMGDHAVNVARRGRKILEIGVCDEAQQLETLYQRVRDMSEKAMHVYKELDQKEAQNIIAMDEEVDRLYKEFSAKTSVAISGGAENAESLINLLFVARSLERVGDLASNIAEDVIFITSAEDIRHT